MADDSLRTLASKHYERDVLEAAAEAAHHNSRTVAAALHAYVAASTPIQLQDATAQLYRALVLQAVGHEPSAADGASFRDRCAAAKRALQAWGHR